MKLADLKPLVSLAAPLLGTVIGGPFGGVAGTILSSLFKTSSDPEDLSRAIQSDPEAAIKLKQAEMDHELALKQLTLQSQQTSINFLNDTWVKRIVFVMMAYFLILFSVIVILCMTTTVNLTPGEMTLISSVGAPITALMGEGIQRLWNLLSPN